VEPVNVFEHEHLAQARMEPSAWNYYASGSDDEVTLHAKRRGRVAYDPPQLHVKNQTVCISNVAIY
jgi:hypothetical protein